jgi:hypothetical protein
MNSMSILLPLAIVHSSLAAILCCKIQSKNMTGDLAPISIFLCNIRKRLCVTMKYDEQAGDGSDCRVSSRYINNASPPTLPFTALSLILKPVVASRLRSVLIFRVSPPI